MRKVLVTGGAGFIGSHLTEALVERGEQVRVLDDLSTGRLANLSAVLDHIDFIHGSVGVASDVGRAMQGVECIFHLAAIPSVPRSVASPHQTHEACASGTLRVLEAARQANVRRVVYAGSSSVYGNQPNATKREADLPRPASPYAAAKLAGELYCQAFAASFGLETVCLRYFNVFGPRQSPRGPYAGVIGRFILSLLERRPPTIFGDGLQSRDFCYVANVVQANLLAADALARSGEAFNVGSGRGITLLQLLQTMQELLGIDEVPPEFAPPRPGDVRESLADLAQSRQSLGYLPRIGLEEGLARTIAHYEPLGLYKHADAAW